MGLLKSLIRVGTVLAAGLGLALQAPVPAAAEVVSNGWMSFASNPVNQCNGETAYFTGDIHSVIRVQDDGSTVQHSNGHFTILGSQGNTYELNWQERFVSSPGQFSFTSRQMAVSKGAAPNFIVTFTFDFPPGTFTVDAVCHG